MKFSFLVPLLLLVVGAAAATEGDDEGNFRSEGLFDDFEDNAMTAVQQLEKQLEEKTIQLQEAQSEIAKLQDNVKSLMQESERCKRKLMDCSWREMKQQQPPSTAFSFRDIGSEALESTVANTIKLEKQRKQGLGLAEEDPVGNGPKEVFLFCPVTPEVSIVDLLDTERPNNECLVLNLNAPSLASRLIISCDDLP